MVATKLIDIGVKGRQRIDRYELVGEIASGGMATVYLARLTGVGGFQRFVAIKRLHPHLAGEQEFVQMFLDEARLAAGIHHPNVVPILEVGASHLGYYLVMEYIEGDTLARLLARAATAQTRLPTKVGLRITLDMLAGLHAAHELTDEKGLPTKLVHRDVSPQNVLVGGDGIARITDFGVARAAARLSETRIGQLKGKIAYMAPEQAMGIEDLDRRADVFSAGIVAWETLSGKRLFKAENEAATLTRLISDEIPSVNSIASDVSSAIGACVAKALERDPNRRYISCAQFADALEAAGSASGKVGTSRDLSAYVSQVIGEEITQQREAVRGWLARGDAEQSAVSEQWPTSGTLAQSAAGTPTHSGITAQTDTGPGSEVTVVSRPISWPLLVALGAIAMLLTAVAYLLFKLAQVQAGLVPQTGPSLEVPSSEESADAQAEAGPAASAHEAPTAKPPKAREADAGGTPDLKNPYR